MSFAVPHPSDVRTALRSPRLLRIEVLGGLVVALALVPEAIAFSVVAGVDPKVGLWAAVTMAITISIVGGRPAMISAATGAVAFVVAPVAREHGVDYLVATVMLGGLIQIVLGLARIGALVRYVTRPVMAGFVNALAIFILQAQWDNLHRVPWQVYPLAAVAIAIIALFPRVTSIVPAPLVAIAALTAFVWWSGAHVPTVSDKGALPTTLPPFGLPDVPWNWATLRTIAPCSLALAAVGLMESLMTAQLLDEITGTRSDKDREARGQGIANIVTGLFGGMGGCAIIGQTMVNVRQAGSRTRISTFLAGVFLLVLMLALSGPVGHIPMAALAGVMIMVAIGAFDWESIRTLRVTPGAEIVVMAVTVALVVATGNLAVGVVAGAILHALIRRVQRPDDEMDQSVTSPRMICA